jgi:hypothetical protein
MYDPRYSRKLIYLLYTDYSMAQASRGVLPRDVGGPFGIRIGVSVGGSLDWALRVGAYVTGRVNPSDWLRYSLVVLNWYVISIMIVCRSKYSV